MVCRLQETRQKDRLLSQYQETSEPPITFKAHRAVVAFVLPQFPLLARSWVPNFYLLFRAVVVKVQEAQDYGQNTTPFTVAVLCASCHWSRGKEFADRKTSAMRSAHRTVLVSYVAILL